MRIDLKDYYNIIDSHMLWYNEQAATSYLLDDGTMLCGHKPNEVRGQVNKRCAECSGPEAHMPPQRPHRNT